MESTTLANFWSGFASTTVETLFGNTSFFAIIFIAVIGMLVIGGLYFVITMAFKRIVRRKRK